MMTGNLEAAAKHYRAILGRASSQVIPRCNLGVTLSRLGRHAEAIDALMPVTRQPKPPLEGLVNLAAAQMAVGQAAAAERTMHNCLELHPGRPASYHYLAQAQVQLAKHAEAHQLMLRAVQLHPEDAELYDALGRVLSNTRSNERPPHVEALDAFEHAVRLAPSPENWVSLGHTHGLIGDLLKSKFCFEKALRLKPDDPKALGYLGGVYTKKEMYGTAGKLLLKALRGDPSNHAIYNNLGVAAQFSENLPAAVDFYRVAASLNPEAEDAWNNLGSLVNSLGRDKEAEGFYAKSLAVNPAAPQTYYNLGTVLQEQGRQLEKATVLRQARDLWHQDWTTANLQGVSEKRALRCRVSDRLRIVSHWAGERDVEVQALGSQDGFPIGIRYGVRLGGGGGGRGSGGQEDWGRDAMPWGGMFSDRPVFVARLRHMAMEGKGALIHDMHRSTNQPSGGIENTGACRIFAAYHGCNVPLHDQWPAVAPRTVVRLVEAASITQTASRNFYHFISECLVRFVVLVEHTEVIERSIPILIPHTHKFVKDFLTLLGIPVSQRVEFQEEDTRYEIETLHAVDWRSSDARRNDRFFAPRAGLQKVRRYVHRAMFGVVREEPIPVADSVVFISRNDSTHGRMVMNEAEIIRELEEVTASLGLRFVLFTGNGTGAREAVTLFDRTVLVLGPHGAGLTNSMFCRPGAVVIELTAPWAPAMYYGHLAAALDNVYRYQRVQLISGGDAGVTGFHSNFTVNATETAQIVREELLRQARPLPLVGMRGDQDRFRGDIHARAG